MGKYFGHRTKWAGGTKGTSPTFGVSQGRPPATTGAANYNTSGNMGREGQIIPPNRGQYPRGKSLPGLKTPRSGNLGAIARSTAAMRKLAMLGKLSPLAIPFMLQDMMTTYEWFTDTTTTTGPVSVPDSEAALTATIAGYNQLCTKVSGCFDWEADDPWRWFMGNTALGAAICGGANPYCQNIPLANTWAQIQSQPAPLVTITVGQNTALFMDNPRVVWKRIGTQAETPWPPVLMGTSTVTRTLFMPDTLRPPRSQAREKTYPRRAPSPLPLTRIWGDRMPGRGTPTKTPWPPHVPPPPNVKEKKGLVFATGKAGKAYGMLTEFRDFADCLAGSMPGNPCKKYKNQLHLYAACIARNHAAINMPEAITCMHEQGARDSAHRFPETMGFGKGPSDNPYYQRPAGPTSGFWSQPSAPSMTKI